MIYYRVYGLTFRSDRELPGLDWIQETSIVDYSLRFDGSANWRCNLRRPWYVSPWRLNCGRAILQVWRTEDWRTFRFRFCDGVEFIIDRERRDIWVDDQRRALLQAATHHLLFSLPGFLLCLRKSACLQGAAIGWNDGAIALLGKSRSGKSVLCATMAAQGVDVLNDDLVALDVLDGTVNIFPGYPWICLRPESLSLLESHRSRFSSKWNYLDETYVTLELRRTRPSQLKPRKLKAIYLLTRIEDTRCELAIEPVPQPQALMALMEAASHTRIPYSEFKPQEFSLMGSVVAAVPTYELSYHLSAKSLSALSSLLLSAPELRPETVEG